MMRRNHPGSEAQPDAEPTIPATPHHHDSLQDAIETPVPADTEDELVAWKSNEDSWEIVGHEVIRHHRQPRVNVFFPYDADSCPVPISALGESRIIKGRHVSGSSFQRDEKWQNNPRSHIPQPEPWTGTTHFQIISHTVPPTQHEKVHMPIPKDQMVFQAEIISTTEDIHKCLGRTYDQQEIFLASAAKRQKVEVKLKELSPADARLFVQAKEKELDSWLSTDTVRRILRHQVPEGQLLTWKTLDDVEQKETGLNKKT